MKVNPVDNPINQPAFQKVNQKYLKWAQNDYAAIRNIDTNWYDSLRQDVILFKDISVQDGIDTMKAVRKYVTEGSMKFYNHVMDCIKKA